ncbi:MAG: hypothetical protein M1827_003960 [Pycnora praestabilis]|nr:MAG: hypothetical protein M1827_003960 [Pycnora praestabilis]
MRADCYLQNTSKYKIPDHQNGQAYLTSHRACYVDNEEPRKYSVAVDLKDIDRYELYAGFLKSSSKITFFPKRSHRASIQAPTPVPSSPYYQLGSATASSSPRNGSPYRAPPIFPVPPPSKNSTWICPICSFSNPVPSNFDPGTVNVHTVIPPCLACGIKPPLAHVLKAAISNASNRQASPTLALHGQFSLEPQTDSNHPATNGANIAATAPVVTDAAFHCPRCTFLNHPSLLACEICGAPLLSTKNPRTTMNDLSPHRSESPGPSLSGNNISVGETADCVKFSFRAGGEKVFYERLKGAMVQRKWLLQGAPPIPKSNRPSGIHADDSSSRYSSEASHEPPERPRTVGIAGLERRGLEMRKTNELVIGNAFEDLEALMASAKEIIALAESFATRNTNASSSGSNEATAFLSQSATALGLVTTKDMLGHGSNSESLYLSELSRNLAEFLTDDVRGVLRNEGGIMSLVDLWAVFNRARGGVELVSPMDFEKAAALWEKLKMPIRLRRFKSGLLVVQGKDWNDEKTMKSLASWLEEFHCMPPTESVQWDWETFGKGITPQEVAERFGWSVGVASEELEMAEERGVLCREEGVEGLRFWENWIVDRDKQDDSVHLADGLSALSIIQKEA